MCKDRYNPVTEIIEGTADDPVRIVVENSVNATEAVTPKAVRALKLMSDTRLERDLPICTTLLALMLTGIRNYKKSITEFEIGHAD